MRIPSVNIYKRKDGKYSLRWREYGKQKELRGFSTRNEAEHEAFAIRARFRDGHATKEACSVEQLLRQWWDNSVTSTLSRSTIESYATCMNHLIDTFDVSIDASHVSTAMMQRWLLTAPGSKYKINKGLTVLSAAYQYGILNNLVTNNPCRGVKRHTEQRGIIIVPTDKQFHLIEQTAPSKTELLMLYIAALGGLRQSELFALECKHFSADAVTVEQAVERKREIRKTTKTSHARRVPLPKRVIELFSEVSNGTTGLLFPANDGKPLQRSSWNRGVWKPWRVEAGCDDLQWRLWRHYAISRWVSVGATPLQCSRWAGHGNFKITMDRYGFLFDDDEAEIMSRL